MAISIRDTDELVRVLYKNKVPSQTACVFREACSVAYGGHLFVLELPVIERAIEEGLLVPAEDGPSGSYDLDYDLIEKTWAMNEDARVVGALQVLIEQYADGEKFEHKGYRALLHPRCANHDIRGFVFEDNAKHEYLVTERGGVIHILSSMQF